MTKRKASMLDSMKTSQNGNGNRNKKKTLSRYMQEKLAVTVLVITLALFGLVAVLYKLMDEKNEEYTQVVLNQHSSYDSRTLPYRRGDIVDRNGTYLATSEKIYNLILDPKQIYESEADYLEPTVSVLTEIFGYDRTELLETIQMNKESYYVRYDRQLSADKKEAFETRAREVDKQYSEAKSKSRVKGVWFEDDYRRFYPYGSLACNVLGFSFDNGKQGSGGIEQYYNEDLIGTNGREYGYLDDESNMEKVIKSAENGNTIVSTIDVNIQKIVEKYIDQWMDGIGSQTAAVIVMNPNNGEILAMSSNRRFDLNDPRNLSTMYTQEQIEAMSEEEKSEAWNQMWRNYCVSDSFEPGSPSKALTVAACLEEGVIGQQEVFVCDGGQEVGGYNIKCVNIFGHGNVSVQQSLMKSCNDAMMQMAARLGVQRFTKYQRIFGMGQKTGIDLPGEADTSNLIYSADNMGPTDLACNSFGQTYNCTMVQMAAALSSVINGGSYYEPHVVKQIINDQGAIVKKVDSNLVRETVSQATSDFVREALFQTVDNEEGTGKAARVEGYKVGGKTGTAQKLPRSANNYLLSFAGFAPADDPQVLVYVVVDTPNLPGKEQAHSTFATEIFQKILAEVLPYINVFPDTDIPEEIDESLSTQGEGITNKNEGGLEPGGETEAEPETDENGETIPETTAQNPEDEVIPYDDGLGIPDRMPGTGVVEESMASGRTESPGISGTGEAESSAASGPEETASEEETQ